MGIMSDSKYQQLEIDAIEKGTVSVTEILRYIAQDRFFSLDEVCRYLSLSERTVRKRLPEIKHFRIGSKLLFKKTDVDQWMDRHAETSAALDLGRLADEALKGLLQQKEISRSKRSGK
jgi:excisionase family DNA binding protein